MTANIKKMLVISVMACVWSAAAFTISLDQNYTGAPASITVETDEYGNFTGEPLPVPSRDGHVFAGWFTTAESGGARVIVGAAGTAFDDDATIYARWSEAIPVDMNDMPIGMKENFDWLRYDRWPREKYFPITLEWWEGWYNTIFDQIWSGNGTLNFGVRWETEQNITLEQRRQIAMMLHEAVNQWTRPLIGMEGWPFHEVAVKITGWAVSDAKRILDPQPNEVIWENNDYDNPGPASEDHRKDLIASAPKTLTRVNNLRAVGDGTHEYTPGGFDARVDLYLWCTEYDFGAAGHGSWWGVRMPRRDVINAAAQAANNGHAGSGVLLHEIGHGFGLYDFYKDVGVDKPVETSTGERFGYGDLLTIMQNAGRTTLAAYDQWQIRYYWNWAYTETPADVNRFPLPPPPDVDDPTSIAGRPMTAAKNARRSFRFDDRGNLKYDLGGAKSANLQIFDSRGRLLKTVRLDGGQRYVSTNIKAAAQMLLWKVEIGGRVTDRGRMRMLARI